MPIIQYPLVGPAITERSLDWDGQTCVNFTLAQDPFGKREMVLVPTPGLSLLTTLEESNLPVRSVYSVGQTLFAVVSDRVYACNTLFSAKRIGSLDSSSGTLSMVHNNKMLALVDGSSGYIYNFTTGQFNKITASGFPPSPQMIDYLDGYFICVQGDSNVFHVSQLNDATSWEANDFAIAQSAPGKLVGLATLHGRLFLFSENSTEVWYDAGSPDFPFRRDPNYLLEYGCVAKGTIAKGHERIFWLAQDKDGVGSVKMIDGTLPKTVSTPALDYAIQHYQSVQSAFGFVFKEDGHLFYQLTFPEDEVTWLYDVTMNVWTSLQGADRKAHRATCHTFFNGKHVIGDKTGSRLLHLSSQHVTECGEPIHRERIGPHFFDPSNRNLRVAYFDLLLETGGHHLEEAHVILSMSRDGGHHFGKKQLLKIGKPAEFGKRVIWRNLGMARDFVFKLEVQQAFRPFILGANICYEVMHQ